MAVATSVATSPTSSATGMFKSSRRDSGWRISITHVKEGDGYLLQASVREDDFMVHDAAVTQELSKLMLLPQEVE